MLKIFKTGLLFVFIFFNSFFLESITAQNNSKIILGINGHPLNQPDYINFSIEKQILLLKSLKINFYRIDIPIDSKGQVSNEIGFKKLINLTKLNGIGLLPMLYTINLNYDSTYNQAFFAGFNAGCNFGKLYGLNFSYIEIGNEQELQINIKGTSGSNYIDYDVRKLKVLAYYFKGMIAGLKKYNKHCKIIINTAGWFHFVFLELLQQKGVKFDIVGYHWYSNMDKYSKSVNIDIVEILNKRFKKPIWFTEVNVFGGTFKNSETYQKQWFNQFVKSNQKKKNFKAVFIYELLDEPHLLVRDTSEKYYGIITRGSDKLNYCKPLAKYLIENMISY